MSDDVNPQTSGDKPLRLGTARPWGETTCGFGLAEPECAAPATTHVMWLNADHVSTTCDEHLAFIKARADQPYETHAFGGDCGMPGSLWHHPYEDEPEGYCLFPAPDDASLLAEEPTPARESADV